MLPNEWRCQCEGWWEQVGYGRQPMADLFLRFHANRIEGSGTDIVGPFVLAGTISDDGTVTITKHYRGAHDVDYRGSYDGEGTLSGEWNIYHFFHGRWLISIRQVENGTLAGISELVPNR